MRTRELSAKEWAFFFDGFSRRFRGRPVTVGLSEAAEGRADTLAKAMPLLGVTVEPPRGRPESIVVMLGDSPRANVVHVVREPCRVRVAQLTDGEDDVLIIDSGAGPTTRIDFRIIAAVPAPDPFAAC